MATMEKTRKKIKKKDKIIVENLQFFNDETVANKPIINNENEENKSNIIDDNVGLENVKNDEEGHRKESIEEIPIETIVQYEETKELQQMPTAPSITVLENTNYVPEKMVQYPNLEHMQIEEKELIVPTLESPKCKIKSALKPFNYHQLKALYENPKLESAKLFENEFINTELNTDYNENKLYELLIKYVNASINIDRIQAEMFDLDRSIEINVGLIWTIEKRVTTYSGICRDGNVVKGSHEYDFAVLNEAQVTNLSNSLSNYLKLKDNYTNYLFVAETIKILIDQEVNQILLCNEFSNIATETPITFNENVQHRYVNKIQEIRTIISILFKFIRQINNKELLNHLKCWLEDLIAIYIRIGTWQDHLFLLYHVLRCPAGISSWAISFIQIPISTETMDINNLINDTPFRCSEMNHCLIFLSTLLLPIRKRKEFLEKLKNEKLFHEIGDTWTIIDSDGEEEDHFSNGQYYIAELKESDLTSLLNQIPFEWFFKNFMWIRNMECRNNVTNIEFYLIKFIVLSSNLIQLFGEGLKTYNIERYKQFSKMLSRLIRHTVEYVTDIRDIFLISNTSSFANIERINVEYNIFVVRACFYIFKSRNLGAWQYLAILPFEKIELKTLWKLFYSFIMEFPEDCITNVDDDYKEKVKSIISVNGKFVDIIMDMPTENLYYLLQTFSNMALNLCDQKFINSEHNEFVETMIIHLFDIGFINLTTKDVCYKICRDLLGNIIMKNSYLISLLLSRVKNNFKLSEDSSKNLFKYLPLNIWIPSELDFEIIATWLLNFSIESNENHLARIILNRLNWNFDSTGHLFIPHDIHIRVACLVAEIYAKHSPEIIGSSSVSEHQHVISPTLIKIHTPKQNFIIWCWNMVSILRLHCMDQDPEFIFNTLKNPITVLRSIPELDNLNKILEGAINLHPISIYLSVLCSLVGHSIPQICQKGFKQIQFLLNDHRYLTVIRCVYLIVPLFLECPDSLSNCEKFQLILSQILSSDKTYFKMAKDLLVKDSPGSIVEQFGNMIQKQINNFTIYGLPSPALLVNLWLSCLTKLTDWNKDNNTLYIIDLILRITFQHNEAWLSAKEYLKLFFKGPIPIKSYLPFTSTIQQQSLIAESSSTLWLSLLILEIEHEEFEVKTKFWPELLRQLHILSNKNESFDNVVKKTANIVNHPVNSASALVLFKYLNLITTCPVTHNLIPILCQKFYYLYLERVPLTADELQHAHTYGVADKFYQSNIPLMKKFKKYLNDVHRYHVSESTVKDNQNNLDILNFHKTLSKLYRTFTFWLEEANKLDETNLSSHCTVSPNYDVKYLQLIFTKNMNYWLEYINFKDVDNMQTDAMNSWLKITFRYPIETENKLKSSKSITTIGITDKISRHLNSYDKPIKPPIIKRHQLRFTYLMISTFNEATVSKLNRNLDRLNELSRKYFEMFQSIKSLNDEYTKTFCELYENNKTVRRTKLECSLRGRCCERLIDVDIWNVSYNKNIEFKLKSNRDKYLKIFNRHGPQSISSDTLHIAQMQHTIRRIVEIYEYHKYNNSANYIRIMNVLMLPFFYETVNFVSHFIESFSPAKELCDYVLSSLGIFIVDNLNWEAHKLLKLIFEKPHLINTLMNLFTPINTTPETFVTLYKCLVDMRPRQQELIIFDKILSKFDIAKWLDDIKPAPSLINNKLLIYVFEGLKNFERYSPSIQVMFLNHLINIIEYDLPNEIHVVLPKLLTFVSGKKIKVSVPIEILNTLYRLVICSNELYVMNLQKSDFEYFATNQDVLTYVDIRKIMKLFETHFIGLHQLYPLHNNYCFVIAAYIQTFSFTLIARAEQFNLKSDELLNIICDTYSPWLTPITRNNKLEMLMPWNELDAEFGIIMLNSFIQCIECTLETLPTNQSILGDIFYWYYRHYINPHVEKYVTDTIHGKFIELPWDRFIPLPLHIDLMCYIQYNANHCQQFCGQIFLRIKWNAWFNENFILYNFNDRQKMLASLLSTFIKLSNEQYIRKNPHYLVLFKGVTVYPWYILEYQQIEPIMESFITLSEPAVILQLKTEYQAIESAIHELLKIALSVTTVTDEVPLSKTTIELKQILYVRSVVRLLKLCCSKYQNLLSAQNGLNAFVDALSKLLSTIENVFQKENFTEIHATNLMGEVVKSLHGPGEDVAKIFLNGMIAYQSTSEIGCNVINFTLNTFRMFKEFTRHMGILMEETLMNYFRESGKSKEFHAPSWMNILNRLGTIMATIDIHLLLQSNLLLCIHTFSIYKLKTCSDFTQQIQFLDKLQQMLINFPSNDILESKLGILWGLLIVMEYQILCNNENMNSKLLLALARHLQNISNQTDGWSGGILGAIGLKRDTMTNKYRIMTKALACLIYSILPNLSMQTTEPAEYLKCLEEFKLMIQTKKYSALIYEGQISLNILEIQSDDLTKIIDNICFILRLFYKDNYLQTIESIWRL